MTFFELSRAMAGNDRSLAHTFEWLLFGVFIFWVWRKLGRVTNRRAVDSAMDALS